MSCCKVYDPQYSPSEIGTSYTISPLSNDANMTMVNYPPVNFSGNMGSIQIPTTTPSTAFTGGSGKSCKNIKIKNVDLLYKKHNIMTPQKDIRLVKRQLMALTEVSFPPFSRRYAKSRKSRKSKNGKKSKKPNRSGRSRKTKKARKMRGGSTVGYSVASSPLEPNQIALANPAPFAAYKSEIVGGSANLNPSVYTGYKTTPSAF